MTVSDILYLFAFIWVAGFVIKFCLMVSSAHVSAGVQQRIYARSEVHHSFQVWCIFSVFSIFLLSFFGWPVALYRERFRFFKTYDRIDVIRDTVRSCRFSGYY